MQHALATTSATRACGSCPNQFAAYELGEDKLVGHIKPRRTRARFVEFCRYLGSRFPPGSGIDRLRQLQEQASMIRRYIFWRGNHAYDDRLRHIVARANVV